ncbi:wax ester/triacylglycerol synthase family O-acyltransferase [Rhodococcus sp. Z13]|uniref:Wax ester/triacylglycerol synthase family O-acyltransferase n=1 Tax=Rhodococcus sacchari TaxID=2962047 RepID=A0ACD4DLX4_9NOCA|nr:wax ester/triacylglycerol synthase family O-acyltransferase [Rhodococcus sp. Z13]UYP21022.1 wax ester/triacylglycerol synthase family O-acyltransferase [Rhodococcus sp. Z13]
MRLPMSPTDSMFLLGESRDHPMHVGGLLLLHPPEGRDASDPRAMFAEAVAREEPPGPLWCKRPVRSLLTLGQWAWEDDPRFSIDYHVRFNALPSPGTMDELWELVSRLHASLLDRTRPLWEMHLIEGLADGRYALYVKIHHALTDGVGAMRLLRRALSTDPERTDMPAPWAVPDASPVARSTVGAAIGFPGTLVRAVTGAVSETVHVAGELAGVVPALVGTLDRALHNRGGSVSLSAPRTMFNRQISGSRRFAARSWPLERLRLVAKAADVTVNDVVLELSGGALRAFLAEHDALPDESLVAMVPVSLRRDKQGGGNDIGILMCPLGTQCQDPVERLACVRQSMAEGKRAMGSMSSLGRLAASAVGIAPLAVGVVTGNRAPIRPAFNIIVSNVPGPDTPLFWNGARVDALYPLSVPVDGQALNITCTSTDDEIAFGLTACGRTVPDLGKLLDHLDAELESLETALGVRIAPHTEAERD